MVATRVVRLVDKTHFDNEKAYQLTMSIARAMLKSGIITKEDFNLVNEMMVAKYKPILGLSSAE